MLITFKLLSQGHASPRHVCLGGLHISPRGAPSRGAKLCTYLRWFARPDRADTEPYYELPLPVTKLRSIFHFQGGCTCSTTSGCFLAGGAGQD